MALKATIFKATLNISDMDRHLYDVFQLTIARHPSETDIRMMVRIVAFILNAGNELVFTKGLSTDEEPELWQKKLNGDIATWIELGMPGEDRLRKACNQSERVIVYTYGTDRNMQLWWARLADKLKRFDNICVWRLPEPVTTRLPEFVDSSMDFQCVIEDGSLWLSSQTENVQIIPERLSI